VGSYKEDTADKRRDMVEKLYAHQKAFQKRMKDYMLLAHEGGTGKTVCACLWLKAGRDNNALVVCPKRVKKKWEETLVEWGAKAQVITKEEFMRIPYKQQSALVVDEADEFASPLFTKQRSQRAGRMYEFVRTYPTPTLLLTATPIRSTPWNLHTLLCFLRVYIPWQTWRERYFVLTERAYLPRPAYLPRKGWQKKMRPLIERYADVILLRDCIGELPPVTEKTIYMKEKSFHNPEWEGAAAFIAEHRHEQQEKEKEVLRIAQEYRKVIVVAHYVQQVKELQRILSKERQTFCVYGAVKDQEKIVREAQEVDECFLILQASLGAGFDADTFSCIIFASMSYRARDFVQMKYRVRRIQNLHPVSYYFIIGGKCDKAVKCAVNAGRDFLPSEWHELTPPSSPSKDQRSGYNTACSSLF
jgi:superfamily II DNA or RNA helicase